MPDPKPNPELGHALAETVQSVEYKAARLRRIELSILVLVVIVIGVLLWHVYWISRNTEALVMKVDPVVADMEEVLGIMNGILERMDDTQLSIQDLADQTYKDQRESHELLAQIIDCHEKTRTIRQYERCRAGQSFDTRAGTNSSSSSSQSPSNPEPEPTPQPSPSPQPDPNPSPSCRVDNPLNGCAVR